MILKTTQKTYVLAIILTVYTSFAFAQQDQITLIDFGHPSWTTPGNWNNFTVQNVLNTEITNLKDNTGALTGVKLTLTDVFDQYQVSQRGTTTPSPGINFGGATLPTRVSRDSFFGEMFTFADDSTNPPTLPSTETTGGFEFSGLDENKYYSFTFFASDIPKSGETVYNTETQYTITGKAGAQSALLNATNNKINVVQIISVQPNASGIITLGVTAGPNNTSDLGFYYLGAIAMTRLDTPSTATWNGFDWDNIAGPTLTIKAVINGDYNTSPATHGNFSAYDLTVNAPHQLTVADNTYVEVKNNVVVNGKLRVETKGNFVQNDDAGTFVVNTPGEAMVIKETPAKEKWYYYTYWSSPVVGQTVGNAFSLVDSNRRFWYNAANYIDEHTGKTGTGGPDGIDDNGDDWQIAPANTIMTPGVGYIATAARLHIANATDIVEFKGPFNTRNVDVPIIYDTRNTSDHWNLIGNPYPSAIDFDAFYAANSTFIGGTVYLWSQATPPSAANAGNQARNFSEDDYAMYTGGSGGLQATPGGTAMIPNGYIPSGQSFMISSIHNGTATFTNAMRMADITSNTQFYKSSNSKNKDVKNKLWINLTSDNGVFNQILTAYVDGATNGDDGSYYDAARMISTDYSAVLYTQIENSSKKFAIQGKDAKSLEANDIIKLGFASKIKVPTLYKLSIAQIQGSFLKNNAIYLKDNLLNKVHNLSASDYTFTSEVGEFNNRFEVMFNNQTLSNGEVLAADTNALKIIDLEDDQVKFTVSENLKIQTVSIFDVLGRQLYQFKGQHSEEIYNLSGLKNSIYIAKIKLSNGAFITKKVMKK